MGRPRDGDPVIINQVWTSGVLDEVARWSEHLDARLIAWGCSRQSGYLPTLAEWRLPPPLSNGFAELVVRFRCGVSVATWRRLYLVSPSPLPPAWTPARRITPPVSAPVRATRLFGITDWWITRRGGMAQVFLAQIEARTAFTKLCVIKTILHEDAACRLRPMFVTPRLKVRLLSPPPSCISYDFARWTNRYYLAMEYVTRRVGEQLLRAPGQARACRWVQGGALSGAAALGRASTSIRCGGPRQPLELVHRDVVSGTGHVLVSATGW